MRFQGAGRLLQLMSGRGSGAILDPDTSVRVHPRMWPETAASGGR
jgi:hypothetical protein